MTPAPSNAQWGNAGAWGVCLVSGLLQCSLKMQRHIQQKPGTKININSEFRILVKPLILYEIDSIKYLNHR